MIKIKIYIRIREFDSSIDDVTHPWQYYCSTSESQLLISMFISTKLADAIATCPRVRRRLVFPVEAQSENNQSPPVHVEPIRQT